MDFRILGPLEVISDEGALPIAPGQRRSILIDLLLHANEVVSDDRLIDNLWAGRLPPPTARKILQLHISSLRATVGAERIGRTPPGYVLRVEPGELDADRVRTAGERAANAEPGDRVAILQAAVDEWRGRALVDVEYESFAQAEIDRLENLRLSLQEQLYAARLERGEHAEVVGGLEALVAEQPLRERARALLMLALYRSGRHAEALDRFRAGRALLAGELGLEPGPELQRLELQILEHDPALEQPPQRPHARPDGRRSRRLGILLAAAGAMAAIAGLLVLQGSSTIRPAADTVLAVSQGAHFVRAVHVGVTPDAVVATARTLWVANFADSTVTRIDLRTGRVSTVGTPAVPTSLAAGAPGVWAASRFEAVAMRLDPTTGEVLSTVELKQPADAIAFGLGALWAVNEQAGTLTRIDQRTLRAVIVRRGLRGPSAITVALGRVWIAASFAKRLLRYEPRTGTLTATPLALTPDQLTVGCGSLWLTNPADNEVTQIDEQSLKPRLIAVGTNPIAISAAAGHAWVIDDLSHSADQINCAAATVTKTIVFGGNQRGAPKISPTGVAALPDGTAWIALQSF